MPRRSREMDIATHCRWISKNWSHRQYFSYYRRQSSKKNELKPWKQESWCIPPEQNASFIAAMEDILEVYAREVDPQRPLVCMDEFSKQLLSDPTPSLPMTPNSSAKQDYEYIREGCISSFIFARPHDGLRHIYTSPSGKRTTHDWAHSIKYLVDEIHPDAKKNRLGHG